MHRRLLMLNSLAILMVVLNHSIGWGYVAMFWWPNRYLSVTSPNFDQMYSASYFGLRTLEGMIAFAIPAFLVVSGFFMTLSTKEEDSGPSWGLISARLRTLIIPYLVWSVIMVAVNVVSGEPTTPLGIFWALLLGQAAPPFYFVPLLVQLYLLGHFLIRWAKSQPTLLLFTAALIQVLAQLGRYSRLLEGSHPFLQALAFLSPAWFFPANVFWFVLGVIIGIRRSEMIAWLDARRRLLLGASLVFLVASVVEWELLQIQASGPWLGPKETLLDNVYSVTAILATLGFLGGTIPYANQLRNLGAKSYGIYLMHSLVLIAVARGIYHFAPMLLGIQIIFQTVLVAAGVLVPLAAMWVVKNSPARPAYAYLFG